MKKLTIKALILSLLLFSGSNTNCFCADYALLLGVFCVAGAAVGAAVAGVVGGAACIGCNIVKSISSARKQKSREKRKAKRAAIKAKKTSLQNKKLLKLKERDNQSLSLTG